MLPQAAFGEPQSRQITTLQPWRRIYVYTTSFADAQGRYAWQEMCQALSADGTWQANNITGMFGTQLNCPAYAFNNSTVIDINTKCLGLVHPHGYLLIIPVTDECFSGACTPLLDIGQDTSGANNDLGIGVITGLHGISWPYSDTDGYSGPGNIGAVAGRLIIPSNFAPSYYEITVAVSYTYTSGNPIIRTFVSIYDNTGALLLPNGVFDAQDELPPAIGGGLSTSFSQCFTFTVPLLAGYQIGVKWNYSGGTVSGLRNASIDGSWISITRVARGCNIPTSGGLGSGGSGGGGGGSQSVTALGTFTSGGAGNTLTISNVTVTTGANGYTLLRVAVGAITAGVTVSCKFAGNSMTMITSQAATADVNLYVFYTYFAPGAASVTGNVVISFNAGTSLILAALSEVSGLALGSPDNYGAAGGTSAPSVSAAGLQSASEAHMGAFFLERASFAPILGSWAGSPAFGALQHISGTVGALNVTLADGDVVAGSTSVAAALTGSTEDNWAGIADNYE